MLQSGLIYFVGRFGAAAITFLAIAAYTRLLSPSSYGTLAVVLAGVTLGYASLMQWLMISLARFMPQYKERENIIRSNIAVAFLLVAALILLAAPAVVHLLASDEVPKTAIILGVGVLLASGMAELTLVQFNMMLQPFRYAMFALLRVTVGTATGIALVYAGYGPVGALIGLLVGHLLILVQNYRRVWTGVQKTLVDRELFRQLAAYGLVYAMNGALLAFIDVSDRYIIHWLLGSDEAGLYAAPYDLAMRSLHVLMLVAAMAGNPLIFRAFESKGEAAAAPLIVQQFELIAAIALPAAITMAMLAPAIVTILLGEPFHEAGQRLLPWVALATLLQGLQSVYLSLAFALPKKPLRQTWFFLAGAVINIALKPLSDPTLRHPGCGHGHRHLLCRDRHLQLHSGPAALCPALPARRRRQGRRRLSTPGAHPLAGRRPDAQPHPRSQADRRPGPLRAHADPARCRRLAHACT